MEEAKGIDVQNLARFLHDEYERLSKEVGWETRKECQVPLEELPEANQKVIYGMAWSLIKWFNDNQEDLGKIHEVPHNP